MYIEKFGYVYILTNKNHTTFYAGVTSNIFRRISQHKSGMGSKFTTKYSLTKLVYYKSLDTIEKAISFEKKIKNRNRAFKLNLIESINPAWNDLAINWENKEWYIEDLIN